MSKLTIAVVGLVVLIAASPTIVAVIHAAVPLVGVRWCDRAYGPRGVVLHPLEKRY